MFDFIRGKLIIILLSLISVAVATWWFIDWRGRTRVYNVTLAAGSRTGESYLLGQALKAVVARHRPNIRIDVLETGGTAESLALLESGKVALAAAQADVPVGSAARLIAVLYLDTFQLLVRKGSGITSIVDPARPARRPPEGRRPVSVVPRGRRALRDDGRGLRVRRSE
jgi:TRAP-type uncharacterized transport system substrate-binding protein